MKVGDSDFWVAHLNHNHDKLYLKPETMKKLFFLLFVLSGFVNTIFAQDAAYQLSSHILDIAEGKPAPNVEIVLSKQDKSGNWLVVDKKVTDGNGRVKDFLREEVGVSHIGIYKLTYYTAPYFARQNRQTFYPFVEVVFEISDDSHYHVPITLSPFGYSTYRGN